MHVRSIVLHVATLTVGCLIGIGLDWNRSREESVPFSRMAKASSPDAPACSSLVQNPPQTAQPSPLSLADIRTIVREELRAGLTEQKSWNQDTREQVQTTAGEATDRQQFIYEETSQLIQKAIDYGIWSQEDRQQLRGVLHELTVPQQDQVLGELFGAIQSGRLKVSTEGAPL